MKALQYNVINLISCKCTNIMQWSSSWEAILMRGHSFLVSHFLQLCMPVPLFGTVLLLIFLWFSTLYYYLLLYRYSELTSSLLVLGLHLGNYCFSSQSRTKTSLSNGVIARLNWITSPIVHYYIQVIRHPQSNCSTPAANTHYCTHTNTHYTPTFNLSNEKKSTVTNKLIYYLLHKTV
jgi:hypothetical protein